MEEVFSFDVALQKLKNGEKVCRLHWGEKVPFIFKNPASKITVSEGRPLASNYEIGTTVWCHDYIMQCHLSIDSELMIIPWTANQLDILAEDWMVYHA